MRRQSPPLRLRLATSVRSGARAAQCSKRSVRRSGYGAERLARDDQRRAVGAPRRSSPRASRRAAAADSAARAGPLPQRLRSRLLHLRRPAFEEGAHARLGRLVARAIAAISDSTNRPSSCAMSAMRGSACITAKLESGALAAIRSASASAFARPSPASTTYCETPIASAFVGVVDAAGQHHVGHARHADQARNARRAAAADEQAALAFGQAVERARLGDADVARAGQLEPAADDRAVQHRDHRHAAELDLLERRVPGARMDDALGDAALAETSDRSRPAQK